MPPKKGKSVKGGSSASDAVVKLVTPGTFEKMNALFTNDFNKAFAGGAKSKSKKGGAAFNTSIGKMDSLPYKIPQDLPAAKTSWLSEPVNIDPNVVPYPQHDLASREISTMDTVSNMTNVAVKSGGAKMASKAKAKAKAGGEKPKAKSAKPKATKSKA